MNIILDLIGASLISAMVLLVMLNLNIYSSQKKFASDNELHLQQNAKTLAEIMSSDLRKIGYNYDSTSIITAQDKKISFYSDIDSNDVVDIVTYFLSDSSEILESTNPNDKILFRIVNNDTSKGPSLGITDLRFSYKDVNKNGTSVLDSIKYVEAEMWIETLEKVEDKYPFTYWELTISPRNLK